MISTGLGINQEFGLIIFFRIKWDSPVFIDNSGTQLFASSQGFASSSSAGHAVVMCSGWSFLLLFVFSLSKVKGPFP